MTIKFKQIPNNLRTPGALIEIDSSQASGGATGNYRALVFGQRLPAGEVAAGIPTLVTNREQAIRFFGRGSSLSLMLDTLFDNSPLIEKWVVALDDVGTAAMGSLAFTGTATEDGAISLYVGGVRVQAIVTNGDTADQIADNLALEINSALDLPLTATSATGTVTLTAKNAGEIGNEIDLRINYLGELAGEKLPQGISLAITPMSGGATNPDINVALANLPDEIFHYWTSPYTDTANLNVIETELDRRWGPTVMLEGHYFGAKSGTIAEHSTFGSSRNNEHMTILDASNNSPTPDFLWAAAFLGQVATSASEDPARPFTGLPLVGVKAPLPEHRRTIEENNILLFDGIATHRVNPIGEEVQIERAITNFQINEAGVEDTSYLDSQTLLTLAYLRQSLRNRILQRFFRHKLANDGTRFGAGQAIVTPKIIKSEIIALAGQWQERGLIEDMESFKQGLQVERNDQDRNRIDAIIPPDVVNQFRVLAASITFRV